MPLRILVSGGDPLHTPGEALVRPVNALLEGITPGSREVERLGGEPLRTRLEAMGALPPGAVALTPGGALPHSFLMHAVLVTPDEGVTRGTVERAVVNALRRAAEWEIGSLVLPLLGAGPGQLSVEEAAEALADALAGAPARSPAGAISGAAGDAPGLMVEIRIAAGGAGEARVVHDTLARGIPGVDVILEGETRPGGAS
jgi:O-acetyl-ADP-ribose deacetylase (regulator of RNase III)